MLQKYQVADLLNFYAIYEAQNADKAWRRLSHDTFASDLAASKLCCTWRPAGTCLSTTSFSCTTACWQSCWTSTVPAWQCVRGTGELRRGSTPTAAMLDVTPGLQRGGADARKRMKTEGHGVRSCGPWGSCTSRSNASTGTGRLPVSYTHLTLPTIYSV